MTLRIRWIAKSRLRGRLRDASRRPTRAISSRRRNDVEPAWPCLGHPGGPAVGSANKRPAVNKTFRQYKADREMYSRYTARRLTSATRARSSTCAAVSHIEGR
jgi:hypothetical protein